MAKVGGWGGVGWKGKTAQLSDGIMPMAPPPTRKVAGGKVTTCPPTLPQVMRLIGDALGSYGKWADPLADKIDS